MAELTEAMQSRLKLVGEKHAQAKTLLKEHGIDCWLTFCREGSDLLLPFVMGGEYIVGTTALMIFAEGPSVAIVADYDVGQVEGAFDQVIGYSKGWKDPFLTTLKERNPRSIAINYAETDFGIDGLTYGLYLLLVNTLKPIGFDDRLVSAEPIAGRVRALKTDEEIERMRRACTITQRIFDDVTEILRPGISEVQIAEYMAERMKTYGVEPAWEAAFCPTVSSSKSRRGHTPPSGTVLQEGDCLAIDFGVKYEGYCSDMMRTWYFRKGDERFAPPEVVENFNAVRDSIRIAAENLKPGKKGYEVDTPARSHVSERGWTFTHALGHQLGRMAHDGGLTLGPNNERYGERTRQEVEEGMVFTLEPVVTWVGIEDDVVVTKDGCEFLHPSQDEIYLV